MDTQAIATTTDTQAKPVCKPAYKRLSPADRQAIRTLKDLGKTQAEIAQVIGCTQQAVSHWLSQLIDTRQDASLYLAGQSLRMAENIVKRGAARDHIQALNGLGVLNQQDTGRLTLIINGLALHGTNQDVVEAEVLSPPVLEGQSEGEQNR
jgi:transcriptional regulator with XRE-family HTH domain